jgi:hypothetical protein
MLTKFILSLKNLVSNTIHQLVMLYESEMFQKILYHFSVHLNPQWARYGIICFFILFALFHILREKYTQIMGHGKKGDGKQAQAKKESQVNQQEIRQVQQQMNIFKNGQMIRHKYRGDTWIGLFQEEDLTICMEQEKFYNPEEFVKRHIDYVVKRDQMGRTPNQSNPWAVCQVLIAGNWINLNEYARLFFSN